MRTIPLGNTGVDVSIYCLGAMYLGTRNDAASSYRLLDQYVDAGGYFVDTANIYAHWVEGFRGGESETLLGEWLRARGDRGRIFLATKVGFQYPGVTIGLTARQIEEECDKSLRRLGVETIDLYYAHVDDRNTPPEESLAAFDRLVQAGKVRFIGASNFLAWRLAQAHALSVANGWPDYCCIQQRYTYLRPKPGASFDPQIAANDDLLDYCRNHPITLLAYSSLLAGAYTRPDRAIGEQYLGADGEARLEALRQVAAAHQVSANQVILAWMMQSNPLVVPVMAAGSETQMAENLAALELVLSPEEMALLTNAGHRHEAPMGKLHGCIPIVATPFTQEGAIDEKSLRAEVEHLIACGVHGLATPAIASEGYKLAEAEQQRVAAIVIETAGGRVPVVVSADGNGTDVAVVRARRATAQGAAGLMVLPPMFIKPDGENLYRYYQRIAGAVEVGIVVQDAPQLTGVALPATLLARLNRDCPNITAVKIEGTPAGPKTSEVLALSDNRMDVFAGWGGLSFWEGLQRGAKGCMPAANFGRALARVYDQYQAGDYAAARKQFDRLVPFINWSMQSVDLSVWCAKETLRREGILATNVLREPASLPDAVMRHEFEVFYAL